MEDVYPRGLGRPGRKDEHEGKTRSVCRSLRASDTRVSFVSFVFSFPSWNPVFDAALQLPLVSPLSLSPAHLLLLSSAPIPASPVTSPHPPKKN